MNPDELITPVENELARTVDAEIQEELRTDRWDQVGMILSTLCAIHCLAVPFLMLALPLLAEKFSTPRVHLIMALFVVPVGLYAFFSGYLHHRDKKVIAIGFLGLLLITAGAFLPHHWIELYEYDVVTILGSLLVLSGHLLNRRACSHCHPH